MSSNPALEGVERALVVGLGKVTGGAVAEALLDAGVRVMIVDEFPSDAHNAPAALLVERGAIVQLGKLDEESINQFVDNSDLIVPSPGVPPASPVLAAALSRKRRVISEIELGFGYLRGPLAAITGTNGKTTTTSLLAHIFQEAGVPGVAAGNIGRPLVEAARTSPEGTALLAEVSSFQLALIEKFRPDVAVVLNVGDDHYDWHEGPGDYLAAKARITENQRAEDALIVRATEPGCLAIAAGSKAEVIGFGTAPPGEVMAELQTGLGRGIETVGGVVDGWVVIDTRGEITPLVEVAKIRLQGLHNVENVLAAGLAAVRMGIDPAAAGKAIGSFESLGHRTELVAVKGGVRYVDDSKATNPHATFRALQGLERVVLIAGGRAKGLDLSVLAEAAGSVHGVVVMGEAAEELKTVFEGLPVHEAADVESAVVRAASMAEPGDTVLLSPACSSLDQYSSYAERGDRFRRAVEAL